ncbi:response regulator [Lutimonas zeaxanthinifaciens]|uniref:response regulator n=1 Tax=Lutimonas zeaxanthinifaciens TaxID=3060215 RepID=UPI00265CD198|nr:response regulator [Lutimonas sp. YSD2104]WKK67337.1 response regulator [Lutimonas sp. YSD2104]
MKQYQKVLIVDDHPLICDSYVEALNLVMEEKSDYSLKIESAGDCDSAKEKIQNTWTENGYDMVFLDIRLPPSEDHRMLSGEDLGELIRREHPSAKIIVATTFNDNYRIQNIFKSLNPEGFLIKNDINTKELVEAINKIMGGGVYYSDTVSSLMRKKMFSEINVDKTDRQILYELSLGTKTKDLPKYVPLSIAGIEKRKRILKQVFDVEDQGDKALIMKARELGFI